MFMARIAECDMSNCVYNKENCCHTIGITVGPHAECNTYSHASARGGFLDVIGGIGACLAEGCKFNEMLECKAPNIDITVHDRHPDCKTFRARKSPVQAH
jgi:hypothetical protein